jgi:hypothetical protein
MTARHLESTTATNRRCPRCKAKVVAGYSEGVFVQCDPGQLDQAAELAVLLADRVTYEVLPPRELVMRGALHLARPQRRYPVLAEHDCPRMDASERRRRRPYRKDTNA